MHTGRLVTLAIAAATISFAIIPNHFASGRVSAASRSAESSPLPSLAALFPPLQVKKPLPPKSSNIQLPDGDGKDLTIKLCSTCHGTDTFAKQRHNIDKWNGILDNMKSKGMMASDDDMDKMASYLAANLGPDSPPPVTPNQVPAATPPKS